MKKITLSGWNIAIGKTTIQAPAQGNGEMIDVEGWVFTFVEMIPQTGDQIEFTFGKDVRDVIVRELTGGIVLHGGDLPRI